LGPGFITGASDDDPTAIAAYTQAGAQFGYSQNWTALFTFPLMVTVQEMCGRIGLVTGKGLAGVLRQYYPKPMVYLAVFLLFVSNTINIGADLGIMAASGQLLVPLPFVVWLTVITVVTLLIEIFVSYKVYARYLKYLALTLLSYVAVAFLVQQDWREVISSIVVPTITWNKDYMLNLMAILGTNLSPYLFFWQADEEAEEEVEHGKIRSMGRGVPKITNKDVANMRSDTMLGMLFSNVVVLFIGITAASTLGKAGITSITTPAQAALALEPLAGKFTFMLFTLGILGSGLLAVPVLASSASYALSESFGWKEGLYRKFNQAHGFYGVIILATIVGLIVNIFRINPIQMLLYSAALNGILAPILLVFIMLICNNHQVVGERTNNRSTNLLGFLTIGVLSIFSVIYLVVTFL